MLPEHNQYFNRPTYQSSSASAASFRDSVTHRSTHNGNKRGAGTKQRSDRSSAFDAQSIASLDQRKPRKPKGNRAMQAMRDSIDTESVKFSQRDRHGRTKGGKGGPILQDQVNRQQTVSSQYSEESGATSQREQMLLKQLSKADEVPLHSIDENDDRSESGDRRKQKRKAKATKGSKATKKPKEVEVVTPDYEEFEESKDDVSSEGSDVESDD